MIKWKDRFKPVQIERSVIVADFIKNEFDPIVNQYDDLLFHNKSMKRRYKNFRNREVIIKNWDRNNILLKVKYTVNINGFLGWILVWKE